MGLISKQFAVTLKVSCLRVLISAYITFLALAERNGDITLIRVNPDEAQFQDTSKFSNQPISISSTGLATIMEIDKNIKAQSKTTPE